MTGLGSPHTLAGLDPAIHETLLRFRRPPDQVRGRRKWRSSSGAPRVPGPIPGKTVSAVKRSLVLSRCCFRPSVSCCSSSSSRRRWRCSTRHFAAKKAVLVVASYYLLRAVGLALLLSARGQHGAQLCRRAADRRQRATRARGAWCSAVGGGAAPGAARHLQVSRFLRARRPTSWRICWACSTSCRFSKYLLPVGISFFTFHGISYITDVYRGDVAVCRRPARHGALHVVLPAAGRRADRARRLFPAAAGAAVGRADPDRRRRCC